MNALAPYAAISLGVWLVIYLVRRFAPRVWLHAERFAGDAQPLLAAPSVALGAVVSAYLAGSDDLAVVFYGAAAGALAPVWHHVLKASPLPYRGTLGAAGKAADARIRRTLGGSLVVLMCVGCGAANYEVCRADARARFHSDAEKCEDEACIEALSERESAELRGCR